MNVFNVLLVLGVFLAGTDEAVGHDICHNRTRAEAPPGNWTSCAFYCNAGSVWLRGFFTDGSWCMYTYGVNGTCYNGYCYQTLPEGVSFPGTVETTVTTQLTTESTTVQEAETGDSDVEKTEESTTIQPTTQEATSVNNSVTETDAPTTERSKEEKKRKKKSSKKKKDEKESGNGEDKKKKKKKKKNEIQEY